MVLKTDPSTIPHHEPTDSGTASGHPPRLPPCSALIGGVPSSGLDLNDPGRPAGRLPAINGLLTAAHFAAINTPVSSPCFSQRGSVSSDSHGLPELLTAGSGYTSSACSPTVSTPKPFSQSPNLGPQPLSTKPGVEGSQGPSLEEPCQTLTLNRTHGGRVAKPAPANPIQGEQKRVKERKARKKLTDHCYTKQVLMKQHLGWKPFGKLNPNNSKQNNLETSKDEIEEDFIDYFRVMFDWKEGLRFHLCRWREEKAREKAAREASRASPFKPGYFKRRARRLFQAAFYAGIKLRREKQRGITENALKHALKSWAAEEVKTSRLEKQLAERHGEQPRVTRCATAPPDVTMEAH